MIETELHQALETIADAYPTHVPAKISKPVLTFRRISTSETMLHDGPSGVSSLRFQITAHALKHSEALTLASEVRELLDGESLGLASPVRLVEIVNEYDLGFQTETDTWQIALDAMLSSEQADRILAFDADGQSDGVPIGEDVFGFDRQRVVNSYPASRIYTTAEAAAGKTSSAFFETGPWRNYADLMWFGFWSYVIRHEAPGVTDFDVVACMKSNSDGWLAIGLWGTRGTRVHNVDLEIDTTAGEIDFYVHDGEHGYYAFSDPVALVGVDVSGASDLWWWVRLRKRGDLVSARLWQDGDPEPETWAIENFDTKNPSYDGGGMLHQWINMLEIYFDHSVNAMLWIQEISVQFA